VRSRSKRKRNLKKILVLVSDVDSSEMLERIVKDLHDSELLIKVVAIGNPEMKLVGALRDFNIQVKVIRKRRKHLLPLMVFPVVREFLYFRPNISFASGQYASFIGISIAFLFHTRTRIFIRHHTNSNSRFNLRSGIWVDKINNQAATKIVAVSRIVQKTLVDDENVALEKVTVIPNGIDTAHFLQTRKDPEKENHNKDEIFKIGVVSRITQVKGVEYIAEAFVKFNTVHPNSHLEIVGAFADSYNKVVGKLSQLDSDSYTLSETTNSVQNFLSSLDVFVHVPIGPIEEAFGLVYLESLASGIPTVFTVSGVLHEIVELDRFTLLVPHKDSNAIFRQLLAIREATYPKREFLPEDLLSRFSLDQMSKSYLKLLRG
jgi:glycosyltransferase involved in cell wall biosynthesis